MDEVRRIARERRPKMILAGWSAYPRQLDFRALPRDRRRGRGLPDRRHGPLRRARRRRAASQPGAVCRRGHDHDPQDDRRRPRRDDPVQGGATPRRSTRPCSPASRAGRSSTSSPARRWRCGSPQSEPFRERQERTLAGARAVGRRAAVGRRRRQRADRRHRRAPGAVRPARIRARRQAGRGPPAAVGITVNRNAVPFDPRPPAVSSGLRIGTPALATRGLQVEDFVEIGKIIAAALTARTDFEGRRGELAERAEAIAERYPLYAGLSAPSGWSRAACQSHPARGARLGDGGSDTSGSVCRIDGCASMARGADLGAQLGAGLAVLSTPYACSHTARPQVFS